MAKNNPVNKAASMLMKPKAAKVLLIIGIILFGVTGYIWWRQVASSPRNVFYGMLESNLKTWNVAKTVSQDSGVQNLTQTIQLQSAGDKIARSATTLSQEGDSSTVVRTENIGTPKADYVRYTEIQTEQTGASGEPLDFSQVLNIWGRSTSQGDSTSGELFGETMLGLVPLGFVPADERSDLIKLIKEQEVYDVDFGKVDRHQENGRPRYTYPVSVDPEAYITVMKRFAEAIGLKQLEDLDPANFKNAPGIELKLTVDVWSRQLTKVEFVESRRTEVYGGYGARVPVDIPEETIRVEELQQRLQQVQ